MIDRGAATDVHEERAWLHRGEPGGPDEASRGVGSGQGGDDRVERAELGERALAGPRDDRPTLTRVLSHDREDGRKGASSSRRRRPIAPWPSTITRMRESTADLSRSAASGQVRAPCSILERLVEPADQGEQQRESVGRARVGVDRRARGQGHCCGAQPVCDLGGRRTGCIPRWSGAPNAAPWRRPSRRRAAGRVRPRPPRCAGRPRPGPGSTRRRVQPKTTAWPSRPASRTD